MSDVPSNLIPTRITQLPVAPEASEDSLMMIVYQGNNYQIRVGDLLSVAGVPVTRQVIAGTGLTGGGQLSSNVTLSVAPGGIGSTQLANSGVTPGTYGTATEIPVMTVDETGRVVAATTIPATVSGYVPTTREVIAGPGLSGGGALNANVTLSADYSESSPLPVEDTGNAGVSNELSRADHQHPAVDLSDQTQVNGILPMDQGGTARSLVPNEGGIVWSGADGIYIGPAGVYGQVLVSNGQAQYIWAYVDVDIPRPANTVRAGPESGADEIPTFRHLVNDDIPDTLSDKSFNNVDINSGTIDNTTIGGAAPAAGTFTTATATTVNATNVNATTVDTANIEVTTIKARDGTSAGSVANTTGVVTLNSSVLTITDINGGTIDNTVIGGTTPVSGSFTNIFGNRIDMNVTPPAQADQEGRIYWNSADNAKTLNIGMAGGQVVQQVGEELFYRVKASAPISNGQVVMFTGTVGASGGLVAAPATGLSATQSEYILGVATENIALNGWGYVTFFGEVRGINTTGGAESWVDGQVLYYNPAVAGGFTKNKPAVPNPIVIVAAVVHAARNGTIFVRPTYGSTLGATDGNVSFNTLAGGDVIVYDAALQYWKNAAQSTLSVGSATTATNIAGGSAGSIPYQTSTSTTALLAAGSGVLVGGATPSYSTTPSLTGTNFTSIPNGALINSSVTIGSTNLALGGSTSTLTGLNSVTVTGDPTLALQLATKQYVDNLVSTGTVYHVPVEYEVPNTTGNLNATYNNGTAGVGATLTNAGTLGAFTPDGVAAQVGDRVLIYNQTSQFQNGVYVVTTVGDGSTPWVLTRATDADSFGLNDPDTLGDGSTFFVKAGNTGAGETYSCNTVGTITFGTTAITFAQISKTQVYSAGNGLTLTGTQFSLSSPVSAANGGTGQSSYSTGDMVYATGSTALSKLTIGLSNYIITSNGSAPVWTNPSSITVGSATTATSATSATTATTATNLASGSAGTIPYQSASGSTAMLAAGTANYVLKANGAAAPSWVAQSTLSVGSASTATTAATATTASNVAGGDANRIVYNTAAGTTSFVVAPTVSSTFLKWTGSAFAWDSAGSGTVTSVNVSGGTTGLTTSGGPITSSGTITLAGTLVVANGGTGATTAADARTNLGATTLGSNLFTIINPGAITFPRFNSDNTVSSLSAADFRTAIGAGTGNGTVTSITAGTYLTGGTITGSGTIAVDATSTNTASKVVARDASGNFSAGTITATLSGNASTATSATSATTATNLAGGVASQIPYQTGAGATSFIANGAAGQVLTSNGTSAPSWGAIDGGTF